MPARFGNNTGGGTLNLDRLLSQLNTSGLQTKDNPLYQVIKQLIDALKTVEEQLAIDIAGTVTDLSGLKNRTYWTELDETANLPASRQVLAGSGITLNYTTPNQVTISSTSGPGSDGYWTPLTDGDPDETQLIFVDGECIAVFVPTP